MLAKGGAVVRGKLTVATASKKIAGRIELRL
jgi:hypothetical protein